MRLAATARRLIEANGRSVTFHKVDRAAEVALQPWRGPDDVPTPPDGASITAIAVFVPVGSGFGRTRVVDPTTQARTAQVCLVAHDSLPDGTVLEDFSTLVDGSSAFAIDSVEVLAPGGTRMIYALEVS